MTDEIAAEALYDLRRPTTAAVSPDGERAAFVLAESDPDADERVHSLFVVPTDGSREPHRLTRVAGAGSPKWSPDGDGLAFLAAREEDVARRVGRRPDGERGDEKGDGGDDGENGADDEPKSQVWLYDLELGGDARQVTSFEEGVREFDWSPDGERLVVSARDPTDEEKEYLQRREEGGPIETERLQHKRDGAGWLDAVTTYLFVVDVDSGAAERLDAAYSRGSAEPLSGMQPRWGPSDRVAFVADHGDDPDDSVALDLFTVDPSGEEKRRHTDSTLRAGSPRWSPDGDQLAFVGGNPVNWYEPSEVYVVADDGDDFRSVSASLDRTVARFGVAEWLDEGALLCPFADGGWTRLVRLDADADDPERVFEAQGRGRSLHGFDAAGETAVLRLEAGDRPPELHALDVDALDADDADERLRRLTSLNEAFDELPLPTNERVTFENADGDELEAIVYLPENFDVDESEPAPTVAAVHGGPMSYDAPAFRFEHAYWTSRGYVVVRVNYRGSTSYGRAFSERLKGSRGELESDDVISGVEHLVERGWADSDRLFVTGFSYGGITTAHVVVRTDTFAAAAPEHGIYDFYSLFGTDDNHAWHEWEFGMPWENAEAYREASSLARVGEVETPLLITAGEADWRCPPSQAEQLYVSVRKQGVDAKLVVYPEENHDVGKPKRATHRVEQLTEWFERHDPATEAE